MSVIIHFLFSFQIRPPRAALHQPSPAFQHSSNSVSIVIRASVIVARSLLLSVCASCVFAFRGCVVDPQEALGRRERRHLHYSGECSSLGLSEGEERSYLCIKVLRGAYIIILAPQDSFSSDSLAEMFLVTEMTRKKSKCPLIVIYMHPAAFENCMKVKLSVC